MVDCATPMGSGVEYGMRLSAGNLPAVGLPAVTTKVCPLQGQIVGVYDTFIRGLHPCL
jgi:hypothetical protein